MTRPLPDLAHQLIDAARRAGADAADAMVIKGTSLSVDVRAGQLEHAERAEGADLGLRVFVGQRQAIVSSSDASAATLEEMATRAVAMAREAPEDPFAGLAAPGDVVQDWDAEALELADPAAEPAPAALERDAREAEAAALAQNGVAQVQTASAAYGQQTLHIAASNGFSGGYARTTRTTSCVAIAGTGAGMERDYDGDSRSFQSDLRSPADIGRRAGLRAVERLNPQKPATGSFPVLFDERISASLIGHLLGAINGSAIARGSSWLMGALGEKVLPEALSLTENPHLPRLSGSRPFDAEGLAVRPRDIVDKGVLTGWTLDLASARKLEMAPTGNAARGPSSPPSPANWNLILTQGNQSREDLLREMGTGLLVTSLIGATINPNTGDYSRGASGFWIEAGEIAHPVNECTIAGNLRTMLRAMVPANDARMWLPRAVPSLLVEGLTLAGS